MLSVNKITFNNIKFKKIKDTSKFVSSPYIRSALTIGGTSALVLRANLLSPLLAKNNYNKEEFYNLGNVTNTNSKNENKLIDELVNYSNENGNHPYDKQKAQHLIGCLRSGEQRDFQLNALHELLKNPKMTEGDDITTIVAQIKHLDKANFWVNQCETLSQKYDTLNSKELAEIITKLKVNSIPEPVRNLVVLQDTADRKYVLAMNMPDMSGIHKDIKVLRVTTGEGYNDLKKELEKRYFKELGSHGREHINEIKSSIEYN